MFKKIVESVSDKDFKKIVSESHSINEVARKLGFQHSPGSKSRKKIKDRIEQLGISLQDPLSQSELGKISSVKHKSNYKTTKDAGLVGEKYFEYLCAKYIIPCFKMNGDNLTYDYLIEYQNKFLKVQVKSVENVKNNKICLRNKHGNYNRTAGSKEYSEGDYDLLFIFSIEKELGFLLDSKKGSITISLIKSKNNQKVNVHYYEDYLFENVLKV